MWRIWYCCLVVDLILFLLSSINQLCNLVRWWLWIRILQPPSLWSKCGHCLVLKCTWWPHGLASLSKSNTPPGQGSHYARIIQIILGGRRYSDTRWRVNWSFRFIKKKLSQHLLYNMLFQNGLTKPRATCFFSTMCQKSKGSMFFLNFFFTCENLFHIYIMKLWEKSWLW